MSAAASPKLASALALSVQNVWRADQMGAFANRTLQTGYHMLDHELPNGGWPSAALIELLTEQSGIGELRLLQPALRQIPASRSIALVQPPYLPQPAAWAQWDLPVPQLLWIKPERSADALWAAEQILRNGSCGALLLWQQHIRSESLRRLHLAAQASDLQFWLVRPLAAARETSSSPLRLCLHPAAGGLDIEFLKRRGPPRDGSLFVPLVHMPAPYPTDSNLKSLHHAHVDRHPSAPPAARNPTSELV